MTGAWEHATLRRMTRVLSVLLILGLFSGSAWAQDGAAEPAAEAAPVIPRPTPEPKTMGSEARPAGPRLPQKKVRRVVLKPKRVENLWGLGVTSFDSSYTVKVRDVETLMKGSQIGFMGFWDRYLRGHFKARFSAAIERVDNKGEIAMPPGCSGTKTCMVKLTLLHAQGEVWVGLFDYERSGVNFGVTGGVAGFLPLTKESDAIETTNMAGTAGLSGGGFFELRLTEGYWVWAQYQMLRFPRSDAVNMEASRAALGVSFEI